MNLDRCILTLLILSLLPVTLFAQKTSWGGDGEVIVTPIMAESNDTIEITYNLTNSKGTKAEIECEVVTPDGNIYIFEKNIANLKNGSGSETFFFPDDFYGNDEVPPSTSGKGSYFIQCSWNIEGHGVNGRVAAAIGGFLVK